MTIQEKQFYEDVRAIRRNINRIADALEAIATDTNMAKNASDNIASKVIRAMYSTTENTR